MKIYKTKPKKTSPPPLQNKKKHKKHPIKYTLVYVT